MESMEKQIIMVSTILMESLERVARGEIEERAERLKLEARLGEHGKAVEPVKSTQG